MDERLFLEWYTGRLLDGSESLRFALGWRRSHTPFGDARAYTPDTALLAAVLCKELGDAVDGVNVRLAFGADGEPDVRLEITPHSGPPTVTRMRPAGGLANARHHGSTLQSGSIDTDDISLIKRERFRLADMADAGANVAAELAAVRRKETEARAKQDKAKVP